MEYEYEGYTYKLTKLGVAESKQVLKILTDIGYFSDPGQAFFAHPEEVDALERKLFRSNMQLLNEQGDWVPLGKEIAEAHFSGRLGAYFHMLMKAVQHTFADFLEGGWLTGLGAEAVETEV